MKHSDNLLVALSFLTIGVLFFISSQKNDEPAAEIFETPTKVIASEIQEPKAPLNQSLAPKDPYQHLIRKGVSFPFLKYRLLPIAEFKAKGLVLSIKDYRSDPNEHRISLSPTDIALGWGPMANPAVLQNFRYYQDNRRFYYTNYQSYSEEAREIEADFHVANIHIIPSNANIAKALKNIQARDMVELQGELIAVYFKGQKVWESSLTRRDSGDGACEVLFLKKIVWYDQPLDGANIPLPIDPQ